MQICQEGSEIILGSSPYDIPDIIVVAQLFLSI